MALRSVAAAALPAAPAGPKATPGLVAGSNASGAERRPLAGPGAAFADVWEGFTDLIPRVGTWTNPAARPPAAPAGVRVASYNVRVRGQDPAGILRDLRGLNPDIVTLQEVSPENARQFAAALGMHAVWYRVPTHSYGGLAVLSRYPIVSARKHEADNPWTARLGEFWRRLWQGEPRMAALDSRQFLDVVVKVGDREVAILDGHLTLFGSGANAAQVRQVASLAREHEAAGRTVVAAGDFNVNFALSGRGQADPAGAFETPTDTLDEFRSRFPGIAAGNNAHPAAQKAVDALRSQLGSFWDAPVRHVRSGGTDLTPEQALNALRSLEPAPGSAEYQRLTRAADGSTVLGAHKRFDEILVSRDARVRAAYIDQDTRASDHQPVLADIEFRT